MARNRLFDSGPGYRLPVAIPKGAAVEAASESWEVSQQSKVSLPSPGEEGLTVSVIPRNEWSSGDAVPPPEHWPFAFADIFTGTSFEDPQSYLGRAQKYGDDRFDDVDFGKDFLHLTDISDIHVRLTTQTGTGGSCTISFENDLVREDKAGGEHSWKRQYFKNGKFYAGARIRFLSKFPDSSTKNIWYVGQLEDAAEGTGIVKLDGADFNIVWLDENGLLGPSPLESIRSTRLDPNRVFAEDQGVPIFDPMQKIKIFAGNRFKPEVLKRYEYTFVEGGIPHMRMPGHDVPLLDTLDFAGTAAYDYVSNIFTGYVSDVSSKQEGGRWTISLTARDVTCWLDYSMLNVNPSLNIFGRDVISQAEMNNWQIFTTRFEGMPAHEIIRAIFLGLREARTLQDAPLYTSYQGTKQIVDERNQPVVLPAGSRIYIRTNFPTLDKNSDMNETEQMLAYENRVEQLEQNISRAPREQGRLAKILRPARYLVGTDLGLEGWIDNVGMVTVTRQDDEGNSTSFDRKANFIGDIYQSYLGIGNFLVDNNTDQRAYAVPMSNFHLIELFARDKLIIDPAEPNSVDAYVIQAYRRYFRQNWPLIQSEYATRRSIVSQVCKHSNSELYADGSGRVWFHPIRAYTPVEDPIYVIHPEETISWEVAISDREIVTWAHVHGQYDFHIIPGDWIYNNEFTSLDMVKRFGIRAIHLSNPNITTPAGARAYARAMLRRINANMVTGRISMILRPELQLARNIFIPWLNLIGYITTIDHSIQWGRTAISTLSLKFVRHPWDPWFPLEYQAREEETAASSPQGDNTHSTTRARAGTNFDRGAETTERAKPTVTFTKVQGHQVQGPVADAFSDALESVSSHMRMFTAMDPSKVNITKTTEGATDDNDPRKQGRIIDIELSHMGEVISTDPKYIKTAKEANLKGYIETFTSHGFIVQNMYDKANWTKARRSETPPVKGFLRLVYVGERPPRPLGVF